jgi:peptide/nickel transport system permease protein
MSVATDKVTLSGVSSLNLLGPRQTIWNTLLRWCRRDARIPAFSAIMIVIFTICLAAPLMRNVSWLHVSDPKAPNTSERLQGPSTKHWLGTDQLGRDTYSRVLYGGRVSLPAGLTAVGVAAFLGIILGVVAGYYGGLIDTIVGRWVDAQLAFPNLLALIALVSAFGRSLTVVMIVVGIVSFPQYYRLTRGQVLQVREFDYVNAARALGASRTRQMFRHILPNSLNPLIILTSLAAGGAVLTLSNLSFLGLGPSNANADWGAMFNDALTNFRLQPWLVVGPGVCVFISVLSFYMLGDALRDILDPRLRAGKKV